MAPKEMRRSEHAMRWLMDWWLGRKANEFDPPWRAESLGLLRDELQRALSAVEREIEELGHDGGDTHA
jgi:hypothetical protein